MSPIGLAKPCYFTETTSSLHWPDCSKSKESIYCSSSAHNWPDCSKSQEFICCLLSAHNWPDCSKSNECIYCWSSAHNWPDCSKLKESIRCWSSAHNWKNPPPPPSSSSSSSWMDGLKIGAGVVFVGIIGARFFKFKCKDARMNDERNARIMNEKVEEAKSERTLRMAIQERLEKANKLLEGAHQLIARMNVFYKRECPICMKRFDEAGYPVLWCGHKFHKHCLAGWWLYNMDISLTCPFCKRKCPKDLVDEYCKSLGLQIGDTIIEMPTNGVVNQSPKANWWQILRNLFRLNLF